MNQKLKAVTGETPEQAAKREDFIARAYKAHYTHTSRSDAQRWYLAKGRSERDNDALVAEYGDMLRLKHEASFLMTEEEKTKSRQLVLDSLAATPSKTMFASSLYQRLYTILPKSKALTPLKQLLAEMEKEGLIKVTRNGTTAESWPYAVRLLDQTETIESRWTGIAHDQLVGRRIIAVRYLSQEEATEMGWYQRPIVLILDDGNLIFPSQDDEGNDGGALFTNNETQPVIPVI